MIILVFKEFVSKVLDSTAQSAFQNLSLMTSISKVPLTMGQAMFKEDYHGKQSGVHL